MTQYQQPPHPTPGPKQKHTVRNTLLIVLALAVIAYPAFHAFIFAYTGVRLAWASLEKHEVVYKVTGAADLPKITYTDGQGHDTEISKASLPWESEPLTTKGRNQYLSVAANQQSGDRGTVRCEIWVDGKLAVSEDPEQQYPGIGLHAHCTHFP
jgi:Mycobacterium membrane protein